MRFVLIFLRRGGMVLTPAIYRLQFTFSRFSRAAIVRASCATAQGNMSRSPRRPFGEDAAAVAGFGKSCNA